ncbi:MAG: BNR repeat-containing protein [Planctomycetota bacterium]|jgi:hypothetical protein
MRLRPLHLPLALVAAVIVGCQHTASPAEPAAPVVREVPLAEGWADSSVNAVIFRRNSLASGGRWQFAGFYDGDGRLCLARREREALEWEVAVTQYTGRVQDAHNAISLMVDGAGTLHVSWDHHGHQLNYARSVEPFGLELGPRESLTGHREARVTYPEFYALPGGGLWFLYRDGGSGRGDLLAKTYDPGTRRWSDDPAVLVSGEGERNAYWQACIAPDGTRHLSWVWRETGNVATNHDLAYARSGDGGLTWTDSTGRALAMPITESTAEVAWSIPQNSELINTTTMAVDGQGLPHIATYFRDGDDPAPQYQLISRGAGGWTKRTLSERTTPFSLSGGGTKRIPISRCQLLIDAGLRVGAPGSTWAALLFRDAERGSRASALVCRDFPAGPWQPVDLSERSVGQWEPTYDTVRWDLYGEVDLFLQRVGQGDGETLEALGPQPIAVLEWRP